MKKLNFFACLIFNIAFYSLNYAQVYEYEFTPPDNIDSDGYARYKIYIPERIDTVKGVYCYVPGWQGSSLNQVVNTDYQEYVEEKGFALMCFQMLGSYTDVTLWSGEALVRALEELSILSGHPELKYSAVLFNGHSAGGQFSYHFTQYKPERVIAFVTIKGGYHSLSSAGMAIHVPGYMFIGENDQNHRITNLTTIFENNRPNGALWSLAMEPDAGHGRVSIDIIHNYFDEIIPLRIPEIISFDAVPTLKKVQGQDSWLASRTTYDIDAYAEYQGDKEDACWFPNERIAQEWQNFVHKNHNTIIQSTKNHELRIYPNPAKKLSKSHQ